MISLYIVMFRSCRQVSVQTSAVILRAVSAGKVIRRRGRRLQDGL